MNRVAALKGAGRWCTVVSFEARGSPKQAELLVFSLSWHDTTCPMHYVVEALASLTDRAHILVQQVFDKYEENHGSSGKIGKGPPRTFLTAS